MLVVRVHLARIRQRARARYRKPSETAADAIQRAIEVLVPRGFRRGEEIELHRGAELGHPHAEQAQPGGGLGREPGIEQLDRDAGDHPCFLCRRFDVPLAGVGGEIRAPDLDRHARGGEAAFAQPGAAAVR